MAHPRYSGERHASLADTSGPRCRGLPRDAVAKLLVILVASLAPTLAAQEAVARGGASLSGIVRDSISGLPPIRTWVCARALRAEAGGPTPCVEVDSTGNYRLDGLRPGRFDVAVQCTMAKGWRERIASAGVKVGESEETRRDWTVSTTGCDKRRLRQTTGVYRGRYYVGFEASTFVPCPGEGWFLPSDTVGVGVLGSHSAWVIGAERGAGSVKWPHVSGEKYGDASYYVRWKGTATGPDHYGHLGGSPFLFHVDSILEVRPVGDDDCRQR